MMVKNLIITHQNKKLSILHSTQLKILREYRSWPFDEIKKMLSCNKERIFTSLQVILLVSVLISSLFPTLLVLLSKFVFDNFNGRDY